ncbi:MAG: excinuclease ABC subunit UvrC [Ruminococcaceae bacterium]|nr:excinuclease ABC subunit UvrC [Oscillospiraceae bacterium]
MSVLDKKFLNNLPEEPGVYIMKNKDGKVIYVGKAKILKNRVRQYFQNTASHTSKVRAMVSNIHSFEYIITDSEIEALILECNLIKKYKPYYNILLKDDKNFPYIKVTLSEEYPRLEFTRRLVKDGAKYFGPYTNSFSVRQTIDMVKKLVKIPTCNIKLPADMGRKRTCLNAHINQCVAPCVNNMTKEEYRKLFKDACSFLEGNHSELLNRLTDEMQQASNDMEFERAALLRDKIKSIKQLEEKQKIISKSQEDEDVIGFYQYNNKTFAEVFFVRRGILIGRHNCVIDRTEGDMEEQIAADFVKQFYGDTSDIPKNIYISVDSSEYSLISEWLTVKTGRKTVVKCPKRGEKVSLTQMAVKNAHQSAVNYLLKKAKADRNVDKTVIDFSQELGLKRLARRIEAYDISNTSGSENVGSMVVFHDGKPLKSAYRKFKIETVQGADDYKSMAEVIYRRFKNAKEEELLIAENKLEEGKAKFLPMPDCILLDGGKGHVSTVCELLEMLDIFVPVFGMVKDDRHRTKGLVSSNGEEVIMKNTSQVFFMITRIQDEVHRFAVKYHNELRKKKMASLALLEIDGVGKATAIKVMKHFKTMSAIKNAEIDELMAVKGITKRAAINIFNFFNKTT